MLTRSWKDLKVSWLLTGAHSLEDGGGREADLHSVSDLEETGSSSLLFL